ncbi:molecular chaperone [Cupriavidus sp. CuC1]|uniref:molecular chaperone n=1 Tax=Cupriavidus sp. CuC1 TaxID=3373131 RepID=UPI0037D2D9A2
MRLNNTGSEPVLVQSWLDDGRADVPPEKVQVPFMLAPAVTRVEPSKGAVLRITYTQEPLPSDRETVFWLNVLEVPSKKEGGENVLQFAFRSRLKVFFRPTQLTEVDGAPGKLAWKLATVDGQGAGGKTAKQLAVEVSNPTPYYFSFGRVEARLDGKFVSAGGGMVAPLGKETFVLPEARPGSHPSASVRYEVINDYGGRYTEEKPLAQ